MSTVAREPTAEEQEAEFRRDWEAANGHVPGRAADTPLSESGAREIVRILDDQQIARRRGKGMPNVRPHLPDPESKIGVAWEVIQTRLPGRFTLEECTIACWVFNPSMFGLRGYESQHPDTRRVLECFCGRSSLVARGLVKRVSPNRFEVAKP